MTPRASLFPVVDQAGVFLVGDLAKMPPPPSDAIGIVFRDTQGAVIITCYVERQRVDAALWERAYQYLNSHAEPIAPRPVSSGSKLELVP